MISIIVFKIMKMHIKYGKGNEKFGKNIVNLNTHSIFQIPLITTIQYFSNLENNFFLLLSVVQLLTLGPLPSDLSPTGPYSTFIPLMLCLMLEIIKNVNTWYNNWYKSSQTNNKMRTFLYEKDSIHIKKNKYIHPGNVILLFRGDVCPVDGIVVKYKDIKEFKTSFALLYGETKTNYTFPFISKTLYNKLYMDDNDVYHLNMNCISEKVDKSSIIRAGTVIGSETIKIWVFRTPSSRHGGVGSQDSQSSQYLEKYNNKNKNSTLDNHIAKYMIKVSSKLLTSLIFLFTSMQLFLNGKYSVKYGIYYAVQGWILFNGVIPFSVKVLLMFVRQMQTIAINNLWISWLNSGKTTINRFDRIDELACIEHIVTDKTGTLTTNSLSFGQLWYINDSNVHTCNVDKPYITSFNLKYSALYYCIHMIDGEFDTDEDKAIKLYLSNYKDFGEFEKIKTIPFTCERKLSSTIVCRDFKHWIFCKGSVSKFREITRFQDLEMFEKAVKLSINVPELRILAYGCRLLDNFANTDEPQNMEKNLQFLGLIGFWDPTQPNINKTIQMLHQNDIILSMATGDQKHTAINVAKKIGIMNEKTLVVNGLDLDSKLYSNLESLGDVKSNVILYGASAKDKEKLVKMLKKSGNLVAAIGDGFNDISMMKEADVSIGVTNNSNEQIWSFPDFLIDNFNTLPYLFKNISLKSLANNTHLVNATFYRATFVSMLLFLHIFNTWNGKAESLFDGFTLKGFTILWPTFNLLLLAFKKKTKLPNFTLCEFFISIITCISINYFTKSMINFPGYSSFMGIISIVIINTRSFYVHKIESYDLIALLSSIVVYMIFTLNSEHMLCFINLKTFQILFKCGIVTTFINIVVPLIFQYIQMNIPLNLKN